MAFLKAIGLWLLKMLLGGIFKDMQNREAEKARREADAAKVYANSAEENGDLEVQIIKRQQEVDGLYKAQAPTDADPFGFHAFNAELQAKAEAVTGGKPNAGSP